MDESAKSLLAKGLDAAANGALSASEPESDSSWFFPLMLSCLAGASTCFGAAVVFCFEPSKIRRSMAFSLSLAAAVMVTISAISILPEVATGILVEKTVDNFDFGLPWSTSIVRTRLLLERLLSLGFGVAAYLMLSKLLVFLPDPEHMHMLNDSPDEDEAFNMRNDYDLYLFPDNDVGETSGDTMEKGGIQRSTDGDKVRRRTKRSSHHSSDKNQYGRASSQKNFSNHNGMEDIYSFVATTKEQRKRSWRVALMLFVSLLVHNFPEGLCVAASAKESPELGITVAIGIFIHNVPEGIAISVPCIAAKPDRPWLAFWLASFSGLAEPLGAIVALTMLGRTKLDLENVLAFVAGVMTAVALWELYPEAWNANQEELRYQQHGEKTAATTTLSWKRIILMIIFKKEYQSLLWGSIVGTALMVATELYLP